MPTVRQARAYPAGSPSRIPSAKSSPAKTSRSRGDSVAASLQPSPDLSAIQLVSDDWIGGNCRFEVAEEQIELEGYQIYAVEKWVVERKRPVTVLTVFTGDPNHKITVTALSPVPSLSQVECVLEWEKALHHLRRDGARPKETEKGIVMVTSLANFRSDYTIVHIPGGNFLQIREQLYTNINVLRMGCGGRSALTLEEPSDTTKDRFISAYHIPDKAVVRSTELFNATVLELVRLIQSALAVCGMFDMAREERNGLLCDVTCEGIQRWVTEIGEPCAQVEPMERVADPTVVAALFSMILTVRNRLHAMGHLVPKDPFLDPIGFVKALANFAASKSPHAHGHTLSLTHYSLPPIASLSPYSFSTSINVQIVYLSQPLIESINASYDKAKQSDSYKVHRVLINKLDDLATDLRTNPEPGVSAKSLFGWASTLGPTTDLTQLVKILSENSKDGAPSLRYLWTGRPGEVTKKRKEKEAILSEGEEKERGREIEREEKERERERYDKDNPKSSEDEGDGIPWSGKVQRKLESWALGRSKKVSGDLGRGKSLGPTDSPMRGQSTQASLVPSVVISREVDEDDILTSGQTSPVSDSNGRTHIMSGLGEIPRAERSQAALNEFNRRLTEFNQRNPPTKPTQGRIVSWADPQTARDSSMDRRGRPPRGPSPLAQADSLQESIDSLIDVEQEISRKRRRNLLALKKRRSFDDADSLRDMHVLPVDRMRIDVELCGQLLIMRRREQHLANVLACLHALTKQLSSSNSVLHQDYIDNQHTIEEVKARAGILQDIEEARTRADAMTQETNALAYESAQFLVDDLWHMAAAPRRKVLDMRERVFGSGKRLPQGVRGAHGHFNREQWTLGGQDRLVDSLGRTESEAEEEYGLPGALLPEPEDDTEVVEYANFKPTWLLRMFNYWGSKWRTSGSVPNKEKTEDKHEGHERRTSDTSTGTTSALDTRQTLVRNKSV
ncbi:hypothetical protein EIP86_001761 [Pleurotus ostreatoroseus]|nr:hypothetical protein EIP86_001761 [Pleurotus ostreatoroseus]